MNGRLATANLRVSTGFSVLSARRPIVSAVFVARQIYFLSSEVFLSLPSSLADPRGGRGWYPHFLGWRSPAPGKSWICHAVFFHCHVENNLIH